MTDIASASTAQSLKHAEQSFSKMVRIKERYLLVNIIYPPSAKSGAAQSDLLFQHQPTKENLSAGALAKAIKSQAATLFGDYGAGALEGGLSVKYLSLATSTFIVRCSRQHYKLLWAALTFMDRVPTPDGRPCIFRVVRVSGTIRKAEEEAIRQARMLILQAKEQQSDSLSFLSRPHDQDITMASVSDVSDEEMDFGQG